MVKSIKKKTYLKTKHTFINQIKDLQTKGASLRFQLDQVTVAQNAFTNSLIASLKNDEVVENMNKSVELDG